MLTFHCCRCVAGILLGRAAWRLGNGAGHGRPSQLIEPRSSVCRPECAVIFAQCKDLTIPQRCRHSHNTRRRGRPRSVPGRKE